MLVGEADGGPDYSQEDDIAENAFGPDQLADVQAKYKSGPLVDAFSLAVVAANDPDIQGAPSSIVIVKTNPSEKASVTIPNLAAGVYGTLYDKSWGRLGNMIYTEVVSAQAEVKPTTGSFTYIAPVDTTDITLRANGGASLSVTLTAATAGPSNIFTPAEFVSAVNALSGVESTGGALRTVLPVSGTISLAASGNNVTITYSGTFTNTPVVGDTLFIQDDSVISGGSDQNVGCYVVTAATSSTISATKKSDAGKSGAIAGTITAPVAVGSTSVVAATDINIYQPVVISTEGSTVVDGLGKSLEINQITGSDLFERCAFVLGTTTAVSWLSKEDAPKLLTSAAESEVSLLVNRQSDNVQETLTAGGDIALKLGYTGTTASVVVSSTTMVLTLAGGVSSGLSPITLTLSDFPTLSDLASYISAIPGFTASVGTTALGQKSPLSLDEGTFTAATTWGNATMRLKMDAVDFYNATLDSGVIQFSLDETPAAAGLPDVQAVTYLSGGSLGATTDVIFNAAVDSLADVKGNFLVPLFSRDASEDIADGLTDSSSTYTIANVQAYSKSHALAMSTLKKRRNRQAFLSNRGTFEEAKDAAFNLATFRASLTFQDFKASSASGLKQFQPWAGAVLAAGMQAAGFYRAIFNKGINCSGVLQAAGDFKDNSESQVEDALLAGLLVAKKADGGGFSWVSDQTTYSKDENFVFNSIQATYVADIIALTSAQRMEKSFVGQSVADVSAPQALAAFEAIMFDFLRLKLIAPSDDAPSGFKNLLIRINGGTMVVSCEIKLAGAIYFIPINFLVTPVTQTAGQ
jgi:hypothetical protein